MSKPVFIGIAGGSASGKTSFAQALARGLPEDGFVLVEQDAYYRPLAHLTVEERSLVNFDHPDAFDWPLLREQLGALLHGKAIHAPVYNYSIHDRSGMRPIRSAPLVVLEGILAFHDPELRGLMDIKVFVDTPSDLRLMRRILRDTLERGRELDSVLAQYETIVRPMHEEFCEPTRNHADVIVPRGAHNRVAFDMVHARLMAILAAQGHTPR
ncbi:MAG: uridine kinase [Planctomycetes bacterium]|nr:uridine kinase [Planctomycetota bacterium]